MNEYIYAYWCLSDNFGDKLTPYIIEKISGKKCLYSPPESNIEKYMICGSILNWDCATATVWGCGIANIEDTISNTKVVATRGYLSKSKCRVNGIKNDIGVGDPALLLPKLYKPKTFDKKYKLTIFPHYVDLDVVMYRYSDRQDVHIINPLAGIESIIDEVYNSEKVVSSSLHGLIVSDAYGIPNMWCKFSDRISGDGTKYIDYYSSIGVDKSSADFYDLRDDYSSTILHWAECEAHKLNIDLDKLYKCCPFRPKCIWNILICTIPQREEMFIPLIKKLNDQINSSGLAGEIVITSNNDTEISIGEKRDHLLGNSVGKYVCFIDDDDDISDTYIRDIYEGLLTNPDCVSLQGVITTDGKNAKPFEHSIKHTAYSEVDGKYLRPPNHLNPIRTTIAEQYQFPDKSWGEDTDWAMMLCRGNKIKTEYVIDNPYYFYKYITKK